MGKQFTTYFVSWRDSEKKPLGLFANENSYSAAAAQALENKLSEIADDGWIVERVIPATGVTPKQCAAFTIVAFK